MIEIGLAAIGGLGVGGALLRWLNNGASDSVRKRLAVAILGAGGPGAVPR